MGLALKSHRSGVTKAVIAGAVQAVRAAFDTG
jgi:microcompartment protein CcmL/EutN